MRTLWTAVAVFGLALLAEAEVKTRAVEYRDGDVVLEGWLAWDDAATGPRPGVLVVHEWWGHNDYARKRAEQVAAEGYVAFALDMYGKGVLATTAEEAGKLAMPLYKDRAGMRRRAKAGLDVLAKAPGVDATRLASIGYCFGGSVSLELARDGADLKGVVSFHGGLKAGGPTARGAVKARVLVLHGAADPHVSAEELAAFEAEMNAAGADWSLVKYSGAVHAFTNPAAGSDPSKGVAYDERADRRSWQAMRLWLEEAFE